MNRLSRLLPLAGNIALPLLIYHYAAPHFGERDALIPPAKRSDGLIAQFRRGTSRRSQQHTQLEHHRDQWEGAVLMTKHTVEQVREKVDAVYRSESRRIFATLSSR